MARVSGKAGGVAGVFVGTHCCCERQFAVIRETKTTLAPFQPTCLLSAQLSGPV